MKIKSKKNIKNNRKHSRKNVRKNKRSRKNVGKYSRKNVMRGGFMEPFNTNYLKLLKNNDPSFKEWILDDALSDQEFYALKNALATNTTLNTLIFTGYSNINSEGASQIASRLGKTLTILSINDNNINDTYSFARMLTINKTLKELYIGGNNISDDIKEGYHGAQAIANALKENTNSALTILHIGNNKIGNDGAIAFADMLKINKTLKELHIGNNKIGDKGAIAFADMLRINNTLKELYISRTLYDDHDKISDDGASALKDALEVNKTLTTLDISNTSNTISKEILEEISVLIERNRNLFIEKNAPGIITRDLYHISKLKTNRKQPENEFFNSLIETGIRLQNLTLNKKIQTLLLKNNSLENNKLLKKSNLSMIVHRKNSLNNKKDIETDIKTDIKTVVEYINSLSSEKKAKLKTDIGELNIKAVRYMIFFIPLDNYLNTIDDVDKKYRFIDDYFDYLDTNTTILRYLPKDIWNLILKYLTFNDTKSFLKAITI